MIKRHTKFFVNEIKPIEFCGKTVMWQMDMKGAYEIPFETEPTIGKHDFNTCENCQSTLKELIRRLSEKFEGNTKKRGFPLCCPHHSNLVKVKEFDKTLFIPVPSMVARKIIYTYQHIKNNHDTEAYYKTITDYIDYTVQSFGQMPEDCGEPLYLGDYLLYVTDLLKNNKDVPGEKKKKLLEFLKAYSKHNDKPRTDLNILFDIYQKWLKEFPFELNSYFGDLKQNFEKQLPILNGVPEVNSYSGIAKVKMHTKSSLFEVLINITNDLLTQVNGDILIEKGVITDAEKLQVELIRQERKQQIKKGYKNSSPDEEHRYRKMIKDWLKDEQIFWEKMKPLLRKVIQPQRTNPDSKSYSHRQIAIAYCVMNIIIDSQNAEAILKKHSQLTSSDKLIQKRINKASDLTKLSQNKTADTKHLQDLKAAKQLISGTKDKSKIDDIDRIIKAFEASYNTHY